MLCIVACKTEVKTTTVSTYFNAQLKQPKATYSVLVKDTMVKHGHYQSFYKNGITKMTVNYIKGQKDGIGTIYDEKSKIKEQAEFKNGKLNGIRKIFDVEQDLVLIEETYANDNFEGPYKSYYKNGQLKQDGQYVNGAMGGIWKYYYETGQLKETVGFNNNAENGPYKAWHENGQLKAVGQYENENREGLWKVYHPNGVLEEQANYKNDWEEGLIEVYDSTGTKIKAITYKNGRVQNLERF